MSGLHIIWFREDLRVHDQAALRAACQAVTRDGGQVMALYVLPKATQNDAFTASHRGRFLFSALADLRAALAQRGAVLHLRYGDVLDVLSDLHTQHRVLSLDFHQSRLADPMEKAVEAWSLRAGVRMRVHAQFHPGMTAQSTESWQMLWERFMARPRHEAPDELHAANVGIGTWPREELEGELGGRKSAIQTLRHLFGGTVGVKDLPSGPDAFAALEPHLRLGVVSLREVWQAAISAHQQALKSGLDIRAASIASFLQVLPDFIDSPNGRSRVNQRARSTKATKPGHQFSLGLGDSGV